VHLELESVDINSLNMLQITCTSLKNSENDLYVLCVY